MENNPLPMPSDPVHMMQALSSHSGKVTDIGDKTGTGMVKASIPGLYGESDSSWIPMGSGNHVGNSSGGMWNPANVGTPISVSFAGGDYSRPMGSPGPPMSKESGMSHESAMVPAAVKNAMKAGGHMAQAHMAAMNSNNGPGGTFGANGKEGGGVVWSGSGMMGVVSDSGYPISSDGKSTIENKAVTKEGKINFVFADGKIGTPKGGGESSGG
jgi:hypothetical protein